MPTTHVISASVQEALELAIITDDVEAIADAFVEMYVLAQTGMHRKSYAAGVDEIAKAILTRNTGQ
jgi:5,10-methenyltetrahydromethanopterin hydrogenase